LDWPQKEGDERICAVGVGYIRPYRVHVVAILRETEDGFLEGAYDTSICSPQDNYDRKAGFKNAFRRAQFMYRHHRPSGTNMKNHGQLRFWGRMLFRGLSTANTRQEIRDAVRDHIQTHTGLPLKTGIGPYGGRD